MAKLIDGKAYAEGLRARIATAVTGLKSGQGLTPGLGVELDASLRRSPVRHRFFHQFGITRQVGGDFPHPHANACEVSRQVLAVLRRNRREEALEHQVRQLIAHVRERWCEWRRVVDVENEADLLVLRDNLFRFARHFVDCLRDLLPTRFDAGVKGLFGAHIRKIGHECTFRDERMHIREQIAR